MSTHQTPANRVDAASDAAFDADSNGLLSALEERILLLDGAMGTSIQAYGLEEVDFRGERLLIGPPV